MAQLTPKDQDESGDDAEVTAASDEPVTGDDGDAPEAGPVGGRADIEARRAATKARMEAGESPKAKSSAGSKSTAAGSKATADDPTGAKARKAAASKKKAPAAKATSDDPTGAKAARSAASTKKVVRPSKRTGGVDPRVAARAAARSGNPKKASEAAESSRYTAPIPRSQIESPPWVAGLMFGLLGVGMVVIFLTYVAWGGRPAALGVGLAFILAGILTGTRVR